MINREYYLNKLRRLSSLDAIKVVTGVRRCGKSTILKQYLNELVQNGVLNNQIQYYNFEDPKLSELLLNWKSLYYHIISKKVPNKKNYIFIDEVQNLNNFQKLVDGLFVNENIDLYITGSNAYILSGELATLLSGRYVEIKM
ncbi:MAG: AAA family ATPase, partial [Bifidobacteriaceae bacterium]|nr:AAA family ATPase [Bifidobacteriaceae bacterium]